MGVPKFFRWLSERYPLINQPIQCPPKDETKLAHGFSPNTMINHPESISSSSRDFRSNTNLPHIMPEFDRLYLDMNGIIHCSSHNNSDDLIESQRIENVTGNGNNLDPNVHLSTTTMKSSSITEDQIFQNVCYYLDRIITDIVQPKQLVFLAVDGVAPRAKLNQQRSRRYRSGSEKEIEMHLTTLQRTKNLDADSTLEGIIEADGGVDVGSHHTPILENRGSSFGAPRFSGTIEAVSSGPASTDRTFSGDSSGSLLNDSYRFHSNCITPGTAFLHRCSKHIIEFIRRKLETDPKWYNLTIIFSGHDVPGEGEHKIMEFIRHEKHKPDYDPNTRHCIYGQDGDLIMLGLATHEPHCCLLREEVVFDNRRRKALQSLVNSEHTRQSNDIDADLNDQPPLSGAIQYYIHNQNFELLHFSLLRDYLALEFGTAEVNHNSQFHLEPTIDDFVFMTFFVGNDFLPHMPALDIGDEAFDLLFYAYKKNRKKWLYDDLYFRSLKETNDSNKRTALKNQPLRKSPHPYLTDAGVITSGIRLESFLIDVGSYEDPYYDNKRFSMSEDNDRMRKIYERAGMKSLIPSQDVLDKVELVGKEMYRDMLIRNSLIEDEPSIIEGEGNENIGVGGIKEKFVPVTSLRLAQENSDGNEGQLIKTLGGIFRLSLSPGDGGVSQQSNTNRMIDDINLDDLKGRYYYEKFGFTPFDAEKHLALRKSYVAGLIWTLEYYYKGCVSWEWYYPYHYGPMLSDLVNINALISDITFFNDDEKNINNASNSDDECDGIRRVAGEPLKPFEQLLGCLPPSSSYLLPKPLRWLMTDDSSPLIEFYPESFTVDMNGKRWPWEAVTLLPFIDAEKLIETSQRLVNEDQLTEEEKELNKFGETQVFARCSYQGQLVKVEPIDQSKWKMIKNDKHVSFKPELNPGAITPSPCFPTLKEASLKRLYRRKIGINVFGIRSRYVTALLEMDDLPPLPPTIDIAQQFIGTIVHFRYPFLQEGFVCAVADSVALYRGREKPHQNSNVSSEAYKLEVSKLYKSFQFGEGRVGSGGVILPHSDITIKLRPLAGVETLPDGETVKVFAKFEVEIPLVAALFSPSAADPRLECLPVKLEKNPFKYGNGNHTAHIPHMKETNAKEEIPYLEKRVKGKWNIVSDRYSKINGSAEAKVFVTTRGLTTRALRYTPSLQPKSNHSMISVITTNACHYRPRNLSFKNAKWGDPRRRFLSTATAIGISALFLFSCTMNVSAIDFIHPISMRQKLSRLSDIEVRSSRRKISLEMRGGDIEEFNMFNVSPKPTPPIEFAHGTTTLSFVFRGGIVAAVDSRASIGNFVGSKTTQKVLPVSRNILGTMAGGAADCGFWIRFLRSEAKFYESFHEGQYITVARASRILSNILYQNRELNLSLGTMLMGYDSREGFSIYYVDNSGVRIKGDMFAVGSGSTFALGILDTEKSRFDMTEEEAVALGIKAIRHATLRDAMSGGYIGVFLITKEGWRKVFSEDLASITT